MSQGNEGDLAGFIWSVADLLRGNYKQSEYGRIILPFTVLRRLDCLLKPTSADICNVGRDDATAAGAQPIRNSSDLLLAQVFEDLSATRSRIRAYIDGFGSEIESVFAGFSFFDEVDRLQRTRLLEAVGSRFLGLDLGMATVSNSEMGYLFGELIRRFADLSYETAGEHFTPRDVAGLVARLLVGGEDQRSVPGGAAVSVFDPTCGTGGMLAAAEDLLHENGDDAEVRLYGQELNQQTWAMCRADMVLKGHSATNIFLGDSLVEDGHALGRFDYVVANPPFGVQWRMVADTIRAEHKTKGLAGRFGAGLPRISDGSFLFLQHMISKMKAPEEGGSRLAVILNGSPLFTGSARSGESRIRRWIIENDFLDTVVALPDQLLYNTRIPIFVWLLSNRKPESRRGTVQLVDARDSFIRMRRSRGCKRNQITPDQAEAIVRQVRDQGRDGSSRVLPNVAFVDPGSGHCAIWPWMFMAEVDPGTHRPLGEFVEFRSEVALDAVMPLLRKEDLDSGAHAAAALTETAEAGARFAMCMGGDIVGNMGGWRVLPDDFGTAATRLTVLRPSDDTRSNALPLSLWLASPECQLQQVGSLVWRLSRQTMVPVGLVTDEALASAVADLIQTRDESLRLSDALFPDPFEDGSFKDLVPSALRTETSTVRAVQSLLRPLTDVVHRAEIHYPYQIAKLARDFRLTATSGRQLDAGLLLSEAIVRSMGTVAAASLATAETEKLTSTLRHFRRGISTGAWLSILQEAQSKSTLEAYPELDGVRFRRRGVGALLKKCVNIRNRVKHAPGMMTPAEEDDMLKELESVLYEVLDRSTWLSQYEFLFVRSCVYTGARIEVEAKRLNGSHPDWEPVVIPVSKLVTPNRLYLNTPATSSFLSLHPFALVEVCPTCRRDELYVLDRVLENGTGKGRSLGNHTINVAVGA